MYLTGFHAIEEKIKAGLACGPLLVAKAGPRAREIVNLAITKKIRIDRIGTFELDRIAPGHRGIALQTIDSENSTQTTLENFITGLGERNNALVLILDEITDPHNYGAILRSSDQFGVDLVLGRNRRSAKNAGVISNTSAGAVSWVSQAETPNLIRAVDDLKEAGFWVFGTDIEGEPVFSKDLTGRVAFILGSEGAGISRLLRERCDGMVGIPSVGRIESLNVSVAAGILLYEVHRQRL
jgi:23S rRNA (guanosine2251-2'-O)-methyltransferase